MAPMTAYSKVSIPDSSFRKFLIVFMFAPSAFFPEGRLKVDARGMTCAGEGCAKSVGVTSGNLRDRSLPITATFLVRASVGQRLCHHRMALSATTSAGQT